MTGRRQRLPGNTHLDPAVVGLEPTTRDAGVARTSSRRDLGPKTPLEPKLDRRLGRPQGGPLALADEWTSLEALELSSRQRNYSNKSESPPVTTTRTMRRTRIAPAHLGRNCSWISCRLWLAIAAVAVAACSIPAPYEDVTSLQLADGREIGDIISLSSDTTVLLIYSPSQCFSCTSVLYEWLDLGKKVDADIKLVLTGDPTRRDAAELEFLRIQPAGVLANKLRDTVPPTAFIFMGSRQVHVASGVQSQISLLDHLRYSTHLTPVGTDDNHNAKKEVFP